MSKLKAIFAVSVLSVMCGFAMAQPAGGPDGSGGPGGRPQMTPPDGGPDGPCEPQACEGGMESEFYKAVNATEEQIEKLKAVFRTQMEKMKSWREANKEKFQAARKSMQEARESKDKDAISKAKEQMKALGEEGKKIHEQFIKDLSAVLDDTQMTKAKEFFKSKMDNRHMRGERDKGDRGGMLEQLGLTDDQKAKIKAIMEEARTKADAAENSEEKREIMESARKKINDEVLTDEQKAKLEKMKPEKGQSRPGEYLAAMNPLEGIATPEQMEQAKKIMEDAHRQAAEIMKAARKKINNEVLNDEQRKALLEKMEQFRQRQMNQFGPRGDERGMMMRRGPMPAGCPAAPMCDRMPGCDNRRAMRDGNRKHADMLMTVLTDDQKVLAKKILDEARENAKSASTPEEKRKIMKAAREKIEKEVLTDEQRKTLDEQRKAAKQPQKKTSMSNDDDEFCVVAFLIGDEPQGPDVVFENFGPQRPGFFNPEMSMPLPPFENPQEFVPAFIGYETDDFEL